MPVLGRGGLNVVYKTIGKKRQQKMIQPGTKSSPSGHSKVAVVMKEYKKGTLHSGKSRKVVKNPKQAIAIALSEAGLSKKKA